MVLGRYASNQQTNKLHRQYRFACYHAEIEKAEQTFDLAQPQYSSTGPASPNTDSKAPTVSVVASPV